MRSFVSETDCDLYKDFDAIFDYCGSEGYAIGFGYLYCNKFLDARPDFKMPEWQDAVRSCLQTNLVDFAERQVTYPTCKQISDAGFSSHQGCYLKPDPSRPELSWCKLPFMDMVHVAWIAKGDYWDMIVQGVPILLKCFSPFNLEAQQITE